MNADPSPDQLREACRRFAELGAQTAEAFFGHAQTTRKADDSPVTQADHAAQAAILDAIAREFPLHAVLTEETVVSPRRHAPPSAADYCWIIDPIDGTRNFSRGIPHYATSVAVMRGGRSVAGAIRDAAARRTISAAAGRGAFVDDRPLRRQSRDIGPDAAVMISSFRRGPVPPVVRDWFNRYLYRNLGSLCLHLVWIALDYADAAYSLECKLWDLAAGILIAEETGAIATTPSGGPIWPIDVASYDSCDIPILVGHPRMHEALLRSLCNPPPAA